MPAIGTRFPVGRPGRISRPVTESATSTGTYEAWHDLLGWRDRVPMDQSESEPATGSYGTLGTMSGLNIGYARVSTLGSGHHCDFCLLMAVSCWQSVAVLPVDAAERPGGDLCAHGGALNCGRPMPIMRT